MRNKIRKLTAAVSSLILAASSIDTASLLNDSIVCDAADSGIPVMEYLDRGIYAVRACRIFFRHFLDEECGYKKQEPRSVLQPDEALGFRAFCHAKTAVFSWT